MNRYSSREEVVQLHPVQALWTKQFDGLERVDLHWKGLKMFDLIQS